MLQMKKLTNKRRLYFESDNETIANKFTVKEQFAFAFDAYRNHVSQQTTK